MPRVAHPDWLKRKVKEENAKHEQQKINNIFKKLPSGSIMPTEKAVVVGDMEDSFSQRTGMAGSGMGRSIVKKGKGNQAKTVQGPAQEVDLSGPCPDKNEDFQGWLLHRKQEWRELRKRRKEETSARNRNQAMSNFPNHRPTIGIADAAASASRSIIHSQWQVNK